MSPSRIILVDDHPLLLRGLADLISLEDDLTVIGTAASGHEGIKLLRELKPEIAILDVSMPELGGFAVLQAVNAAALPVRVVFLTAMITPAQVAEALKLGAWGLLLKEAAPDTLIDCLHAVASGRRWHPAELQAMADQAKAGRLAPLTRREREIVDLACRGLSNKAIAEAIGTAEGTIKIHLHNVFGKLNVTNRTSLAAIAFDELG